ncbi:MAG: type VI secretion system baseplate subunit TssG [Smithella sp.]
MAIQDGEQNTALKTELLKRSGNFSFIQAMRLLRMLIRDNAPGDNDGHALESAVKTRPELSLNFPQADIATIEQISELPLKFRITATFLGLYGVSSPLPTFYTEDLLQEELQDGSASRSFIDIINSRFYQIFFNIWCRHRLFFKIVEEPNLHYLQRLYCLLGPESEKLRTCIDDPYGTLRYIGVATQFPRSAEGLRVLLSDCLEEKEIAIEQCIERIVDIPKEQRLYLGISGNILGEDAYLGNEFTDRMGKFRIHINAPDAGSFHKILPDSPKFGQMRKLIRFYTDQPFLWDMKVEIDRNKVKTALLGENSWSRLGWDTWIFSDEMPETAVALFLPEEN